MHQRRTHTVNIFLELTDTPSDISTMVAKVDARDRNENRGRRHDVFGGGVE